jgi:hypothetical protein
VDNHSAIFQQPAVFEGRLLYFNKINKLRRTLPISGVSVHFAATPDGR